MTKRPLILIILDGWGIAPPTRGNAIALASTPVMDRLIATYPTVAVQAAGEAVGLPWGEMGNSEVGHLNIGAGKIVYQDLPRITKTITDGSFFRNAAFLKAIAHVQKQKSRLHLVGLVSSGGIHSFHEHCYALLALAQQQHCENVVVHAFLDGRDTPYNSGATFIAKLEKEMQREKIGTLASISGRWYAMDRDRHWERIAKAYDAMVGAPNAPTVRNAQEAIAASYAAKVFDEEFVPTVLVDEKGKPRGAIASNDALIFFNFRNDRMRQMATAFAEPSFDSFKRSTTPENLCLVTMTEYAQKMPVTVAFPHEYIQTPLAKVLSDAGLKQLHIAETEKYAHVTFFFNGGREESYPGEKRVLIPSAHVASYDQKPDMSAREITERIVDAVTGEVYDFIVANFANADMVGHTGNMQATIIAVGFLDECVGRIVDTALERNGVVIITADHGNAEEKMNLQTGEISKEHTANTVPCIIVGREWEGLGLGKQHDLSRITTVGFLSDIAPTILRLFGIPQPLEMTGRCLLYLPRT